MSLQTATPRAPASLIARYAAVRAASERICEPLETEDLVIQSMPDVSPAKWHLAHTSWFFETFLLVPHLPGYRRLREEYGYLFNSYYNAIGRQFSRPDRGLLSRPTVRDVFEYRRHVDEAMERLLAGRDEAMRATIAPLVEVGLNHEQQHQELMLTDLKHVFSVNPLEPVYRTEPGAPPEAAGKAGWIAREEGLRSIGFEGEGYSFDNEGPRHRRFLEAFRMRTRPVTNGEYLEFLDDGGYDRPEHWLSDGWATVKERGWTAPLYWRREDGVWVHHTLAGTRPVRPEEPVCHVSLYEADAFARWAGARLPSEAEWETVAEDAPVEGNFVESDRLHPAPAFDAGETSAGASGGPGDDDAAADESPRQLFGDVWEWTASAYSAYPGFRPPEGALGEYNAKFMSGQMVLRGGSCVTPATHIRATYRNFFPPDARWQFSGFRLAQDGAS